MHSINESKYFEVQNHLIYIVFPQSWTLHTMIVYMIKPNDWRNYLRMNTETYSYSLELEVSKENFDNVQ